MIKLTKEQKKAVVGQIMHTQSVYKNQMIYMLGFVLEELINHAKESGEYLDQTSNLRSSIGGVLIYNKKVISSKGFKPESGDSEGHIIGLDYINGLLSEMDDGFGILVVAGMNYAVYVEDVHGLNVLEKTKLKAQAEVPRMMQELNRKLNT